MLDLQLGLVVASLTGLASFETTTHHLSSFTVQIYVLGTYSWHTNFSIKAIIFLLGIALTPRSEKPLMTSSSASMNVFQRDAFHSPETDVSVLSDRRYPHLCKNTSFVTSTGQNHREIKHETMFHALGPAKAAALPAFHVSDGAGNTGCFCESFLEKERHPAGKRPYKVTKMKTSVAF